MTHVDVNVVKTQKMPPQPPASTVTNLIDHIEQLQDQLDSDNEDFALANLDDEGPPVVPMLDDQTNETDMIGEEAMESLDKIEQLKEMILLETDEVKKAKLKDELAMEKSKAKEIEDDYNKTVQEHDARMKEEEESARDRLKKRRDAVKMRRAKVKAMKDQAEDIQKIAFDDVVGHLRNRRRCQAENGNCT